MRIIILALSLGLLYLIPGQSIHASNYVDEELPAVTIERVSDFDNLKHQARNHGKVILLEISAPYCRYCRILEEEILKPMIRSGDYTEQVLIRRLDIDIDSILDNEKQATENLARRYGIWITPTLLFLDGHGNEVSKRILGVNSLDYYGAYVDAALEEGYHKLSRN